MAEVELRVEGVAQEQFDDYLAGADLADEATEASLVSVSGCADGELTAEFLGEAFTEADGGLVVDVGIALDEAVGVMQFMFGKALHADEETATGAVLAGPGLDLLVELTPPTEVQVADAEIATVGILHGELQRGEELLVYVVEDARQSVLLPRSVWD